MTRALQLPDLRRILDGLERRLGILERRIRPTVSTGGTDHEHEGTGTDALVAGVDAAATGDEATALGPYCIASGQDATAIGNDCSAVGDHSVAAGSASIAAGTQSVAIGSANAAGVDTIAMGHDASASNVGSVVIGASASTDEDYGTVVGFNAHADNTEGTALGHNARAFNIHATAIGADAETTATNQVMLGTATDDVVVPGRLVLGGSTSGLTDSDIPATIARDSEVAAAVTAHEAAGDPHTGYATDTDLTTHAATPHGGAHPDLAAHDTLGLATQAELDAHDIDTTSVHGIADTSVLATDAEVATAVSDHAALADPHTGYQKESEKDQDSGYVGLAAAQGARDGTKFLRDDGTWAAAGGAHPDLATHDTLGLATQAELDAHAAAGDPHAGYLQESVVSGLATPAITLGLAAAAGTGTTPIRHDSTIAAFDATNPTTQAFADAAAVGTAAFAARRDHKHAMPANPVTAHEAHGNPHPVYATDGELTTHVGAADPHTGYVLESLIDAAADLIVGTADNTVGRLAKGAALDVLRVNAGATALEWAAGGAAASTLAYAQVTVDQTAITAGVDLAGLSVTVTVPAGRRIRVSTKCKMRTTVNDDIGAVDVKEGATVLASGSEKLSSGGGVTVLTEWVGTPSAGSHTYKIFGYRSAGTGVVDLKASAIDVSFILVEDITGSLWLPGSEITAGMVASEAWTDYTPTLTALTLGNGTVTARWVRIGRTIHYYFRFVLGSTSAVTGTAGFTLPTPPADPRDNADHYGTAVYGDFGTGQSHGIVIYTAGTVYFKMGGPINVSNISATTPFTWATNDAIVVRGTYEAAS